MDIATYFPTNLQPISGLLSWAHRDHSLFLSLCEQEQTYRAMDREAHISKSDDAWRRLAESLFRAVSSYLLVAGALLIILAIYFLSYSFSRLISGSPWCSEQHGTNSTFLRHPDPKVFSRPSSAYLVRSFRTACY